MSRRYRARREAIESKYVAMYSDDTDDMDWEDADFDSLAVYRDGHPEKELPRIERIHIDSPIG